MTNARLITPVSFHFLLRPLAVAAVCCVALLPVTAQAQREEITLTAALQAFNFGDNQMAGRYFWRLAADGDAQAQYYLAYMLDAGLGMGRDVHQAARWYIKSADQDFLPALVHLGYIYSIGHGVMKDEKAAFRWYTRAAQMGDAVAQNNLASMLRNGRPYRRDYTLALQWFQQAAHQGNARAQYNLASMYLAGEGVKKNPTEALKWFAYAANQGDMYAQYALAGLYRQGIGTDTDVAQAVDWYRRAAEQGYLPAQYTLARLYESGAVAGMGASDAAIWYYQAANQGHAGAQQRLGYFYESGTGLPVDMAQAERWYRKAADDSGHTGAMVALASLYERGLIAKGKRGLEQAAELYRRAADLDDARAQLVLGRMYRQGVGGVERDPVEAYKWYALAASRLPPGELRDQAVVDRIDIVNGLNADDAQEARRRVELWRPQPAPLVRPADSPHAAFGADGTYAPREGAVVYD